jgi:GNAT superfamily N-acetyltransferase
MISNTDTEIFPLNFNDHKKQAILVIRDSFSQYDKSQIYFSLFDQSDEEVLHRLFSKNKTALGIFTEKTLCGLCSIEYPSSVTYNQDLYGNNIALLELFCISTTYRSKNLSEKLINKAKLIAMSHGCNFLRWDCPSEATTALRFYQKSGAIILDTVNYGNPFGLFKVFSIDLRCTDLLSN